MTIQDQLLDLIGQFGPGPPPPAWLLAGLEDSAREHFRALIPDEVSNEVSEELRGRLEELVIAFGVSWRDPFGQSVRRDRLWAGLWIAALQELISMVEIWLCRVSCFLHFQLGLPAAAIQLRDGVATQIAMWLVKGQAACATGLSDPDARRHLSNERLRARRCHQQQDIMSWAPRLLTLYDFVGRAIKGNTCLTSARFRVGEFVKGMSFAELHRSSGLEFGQALFWLCARHPEPVLNFEGLGCRRCAGEAREAVLAQPVDRRKLISWLFLPAHHGGSFCPRRCWRCQVCGDLYAEHLDSCPVCQCGRTAGAKRTTYWVPLLRGPSWSGELALEDLPHPGSPGPKSLSTELLAAFDALEPDTEKVCILVLAEGLEPREVAEKLSLPLGTVLRLLRSGTAELRRRLKFLRKGNDDPHTL